MSLIKNIGRRKFFTSAGLSAAGILILSKIPFTNANKRISKKEINIKLNPSSVKRNK